MNKILMSSLVPLAFLFSLKANAKVPTVKAVPANRITYYGANLNALVNPNNDSTTISFEYGLTTSYGATASVSGKFIGNTTLFKTKSITGLTPGKTYHYRAKAVNRSGTTYGSDRVFAAGSSFSKSHAGLHTITVGDEGIVYAFGNNAYGQLGDNTTTNRATPIKVLKGAYSGTTYLGDNANNPIISVAAGYYHNIALAADGSVYAFGYNVVGQLGDNTTTNRATPIKVLKGAYSGTTYLGDNANNPIISVVGGTYHSIALAADGSVYAFGYNGYGQLGDNTTTDRATPIQVLKGAYSGTTYLGDNANNPIISVAAGYHHSIALAADGSVYAFGYNVVGQLGDNTTTDRATPIKVLKGAYSGTTYLGDNANNPIISVAAGIYHSIALAADGSVYAFGYNVVGQLGDNTTTNRATPIKVLKGAYSGTTYLGDNANNPMISVAAGIYHNIALAADGSVYAFGYNAYGQLGDNTTTNRTTPIQVLKGAYSGTTYLGDNANNPIISVAAGYYHSIALAADGSVYAFGGNSVGQLGDNTTTDRATPIQVLGVGGTGVLDLITAIPKNFLGADIISCGVNDKRLSSSVNFSKYKWSTGATTATISVTSTGTYILEGLNSDGNSGSDTVFVSIINGQISPRDTINCNGMAVTLRIKETGTSASNAKYPLKYTWSTKDTSKILKVSALGITKLSLTTTNGIGKCTDETTVNIGNPTFSFASDTINFTACSRDSMRLSVGKTWREVVWSTGRKDSVIYLKFTDQYKVRVKDSVGCYAYDSVYFINPGSPFISVDKVENLNCYGESDGSIASSVLGGFTPYTYLWNDASKQRTSTASKLSKGMYKLLVKDLYGCADSISQSIGSPNKLVLSVISKDSVKCYGGSDGSISTSISGGIWPYFYLWNDAKKQESTIARNLVKGIYKMIGTDARGCKDSMTIDLPEPARTLKIIASNTVVCAGDMVTLTGVGAKTYVWSDGVSNGIAFSITANNIYTLKGTNAKGCVDTTSIRIKVNPSPVIGTISGPKNTMSTNTTYNYSVTQQSGYVYNWIVNNGSIASGQGTNAVGVKWTVDGPGSIGVIASNTSNCSDTETLNIVVGGVGVKQALLTNGILVYPNPAGATITVQAMATLVGSSYTLLDPLGKTVLQGKLTGENTQIALDNTASGVYILRVGEHAQPVTVVIRE